MLVSFFLVFLSVLCSFSPALRPSFCPALLLSLISPYFSSPLLFSLTFPLFLFLHFEPLTISASCSFFQMRLSCLSARALSLTSVCPSLSAFSHVPPPLPNLLLALSSLLMYFFHFTRSFFFSSIRSERLPDRHRPFLFRCLFLCLLA